MTGKTHLLFGIAVGLALWHSGTDKSAAAALPYVGAAALGALLPDLDSSQSILSNLFPPIRLAFFWAGHRGLLHTGLIGTVLLLIAYLSGESWAIALSAGYSSHLTLDMLTVNGIPLLWPLTKRSVGLLPIRTGGIGESLFVLLSLIAAIATMVYMYRTGTLWLSF